MELYARALEPQEGANGDLEIRVSELKEYAAGGKALPFRATSHEDSDNPYAPPRSDVGTPSVAGEADAEALRRTLAPLESFAKAVGIVCIIFAILDIFVVIYHAGWAIVAKLRVISTVLALRYPGTDPCVCAMDVRSQFHPLQRLRSGRCKNAAIPGQSQVAARGEVHNGFDTGHSHRISLGAVTGHL